MKLPKSVIVLGHVEAVTYLKKNARRPVTKSFIDEGVDYLLATNKTHTALYLFANQHYGGKKVLVDKKGPQRGAIHSEVKYKIPADVLKPLGKAISIQYWSDNWEGKETLYKHEFKDASFYAEKYTRFEMVGIKPKKGKIVTDRGIGS